MMRYGYFDSEITGVDPEGMPIFDRAETSELFRLLFSKLLTNGVLAKPADCFQVLAGDGGLTVKVRPGFGMINGAFAYDAAETAYELEPAPAQNRRIDRVVLRCNYVDRLCEIIIKTGTAASSPAAPELIRPVSGDYYELGLALVDVNANQSVLTQSSITDTRADSSVCGFITQFIDSIDTEVFFAQLYAFYAEFTEKSNASYAEFERMAQAAYEGYTAAVDAYIAALEERGNESLTAITQELKEFQQKSQDEITTWFEGVQGLLEGDVAVKLASDVEVLKAGKQDKLNGTEGQVVGFDAEGNAVAQDAPETGVTSFNGRSGAVAPQAGDYSAADVGALPVGGTAVAAERLATARTVRVNLASPDATFFDGTANIKPGVMGTLPISNGGTGATSASDALTALGAFPATGGTVDGNMTITGNLTLKGSGNYGNKINLGDGDYVHISEPTDDCLEIKAKKINFITSDTTESRFTLNNNPLPTSAESAGVGKSLKGQSVQPTQDASVIAQEGAEIFNDYRSRAYSTGSIASGNVATGKFSHAEGQSNTAIGDNAHAEGYETQAGGIAAHAEGYKTKTTGNFSHAEGDTTQAKSTGAHAEGARSIADGAYSHAEGVGSNADAQAAHAEGDTTIASGHAAHAEGYYSTAVGEASHASGIQATANGKGSCAMGFGAYAYAEYQTAIGQNNKTSSTKTDRFLVGKGSDQGSRANCFRVTDTGVYATGAHNSSGADYAEYFEWLDGNPEEEDRTGLFATLAGEKIRLAQPGDGFILGIVSGAPSVCGDVHDDQWQGMYLYDIYGRPLWEDVEVPDETIEEPDPENPDESITRVIIPAHTEHRQKLNPDYDNTQAYIPRSERPEWDAVGMLGKLVVRDDGTCIADGWCTVGENGIATYSGARTKYRVMARLDESHIRVLIL